MSDPPSTFDGGSLYAHPQRLEAECGFVWEGEPLALPTDLPPQKADDAADQDESEFGSRAICIRNKRYRHLKGGGVGVPFWWGRPLTKGPSDLI